jgi:hypothetical protein
VSFHNSSLLSHIGVRLKLPETRRFLSCSPDIETCEYGSKDSETIKNNQLEYDPSTYPTYYRFRKELQRFGLQLPNPNQRNARHYPIMNWGPSDPDRSIRERGLKSSLNYNTPEEQKKRLERRLDGATRKRDKAIIKQAALQEIRRLDSATAAQSSREAPGH